jgi:hypothetical protein
VKLSALPPGDLAARLKKAGLSLQTGPFTIHLQTPSAELARWLEAGDAPQIALGLLCYAGPDRRVAAQRDLETSSAQPPRSAMPSFRKLSVDAPL